MLGLVAVVALIAANAFFVGAEFSLVASDRTRIEKEAQEGNRGAQRTLGLLRRLSYHLSGAQLGITISSLVLGFVAEPTVARVIEPLVERWFGEGGSGGLSIALALAIATVVQMVIGELMPKNLVIAAPERWALLLSPAVALYGFIARPLIWITDRMADRLTRRIGVEPAHEIHAVASLEDLEYLVRVSQTEGALSRNDAQLLGRSIRFNQKTVADILIPRVSVESIEQDASVAELIQQSVDTGLSRFPVVAGDIDHVVGLVHVKNAIRVPNAERGSRPVSALMDDILAIPESRGLAPLLADMRANRTQLAVVIDEHGGTAGIVSMEDMVEEIVGEIDDEYDDVVEMTVREDEGVYVLSGRLHADEVRDACGFEMPEGAYETLAGFVLDRLQRVPAPGEVFRHQGWRVEVVEVDRYRVATVRLREPRESVQARVLESTRRPG